MPFNQLQRRDSWPPTILRIHDEDHDEEESAIDENPFAYFLSSPEDLDIDDEDLEDLSAGIEPTSSGKPRVRSVSPFALRRVPLDGDAEEDEDLDLTMPLSLRDFSEQFLTDGRKSRQGNRPPTEGLGISIPHFHVGRGRARVRLPPSRGRGNGMTRSLPARRPHSWHAPSPDMHMIAEERESDEGSQVKDKTEEEKDVEDKDEKGKGVLVHKRMTQAEEELSNPSPKLKKRVHWAL